MRMDDRFLVCGSGAGEGIPAPFCDCRICRHAREHGGPDVRTRAGYQLGEAVRFDWSPDAAWQAQRFSLDPSRLRHLFITHSHSDHFYSDDFWTHARSVSPGVSGTLCIHGNAGVERKLRRDAGDYEACGIEFHLLRAFVPAAAGDVVVTPLPAAHMAEEQAFLFLVERNGRRLLLGHDSQDYPQATMDFLEGIRCDYFIPDATWGVRRGQSGHMGLPDVLDLYRRLVAQGTMDGETRVHPSHFSPNEGSLHRELVDFLKPHPNFSPAYDGLALEM